MQGGFCAHAFDSVPTRLPWHGLFLCMTQMFAQLGHCVQLHHRMKEVEAKVQAASASSIVVVCRRGNDSQRAAHALIQHGVPNVRDLQGGLHTWAQTFGGVAVI